MNAGTKEGEIKDIVAKVRYLDLVDMQIKEINNDNIGFEYRDSFFLRNADKIVLKAWFHLKPGNFEEIKEKWNKPNKTGGLSNLVNFQTAEVYLSARRDILSVP